MKVSCLNCYYGERAVRKIGERKTLRRKARETFGKLPRLGKATDCTRGGVGICTWCKAVSSTYSSLGTYREAETGRTIPEKFIIFFTILHSPLQ